MHMYNGTYTHTHMQKHMYNGGTRSLTHKYTHTGILMCAHTHGHSVVILGTDSVPSWRFPLGSRSVWRGLTRQLTGAFEGLSLGRGAKGGIRNRAGPSEHGERSSVLSALILSA